MANFGLELHPDKTRLIEFGRGYFIILDVAIGGAFPNKLGGGPTADTKPGVPMLVDYVEVKYASGQATPPPTPTFTTTTNRTTTTTTTPTNPTPTNPTVPPTGVPSNLRVTATADSTITLGWNGTAGATYDVLRSGVRIATATGTTFTDQELFKNTPYVYSIRGGGITTPELTATIGASPTSPPTATTVTTAPSTGTPGNLRVIASTSSSITLSWDGPASASYQVLRSGIQIGTVTGPAFTDQGLIKNTPYIYSIRGNGVTTPQITATIN